MIKVRYDVITTKVIGYYPDSINYPNITIDTINQTIDGDPYIEITEESHEANLGNVMSVVDNSFVEYAPTDDENLATNKAAYIATRKFYLNDTLHEHLDHVHDHLANATPYGNTVSTNRTVALTQIASIEATTTLAEFEALGLNLQYP